MNPGNIRLTTYNVNYSRRAMGEYEEYSWENRRSDVYKFLEKTNSNIIFLQEVLSQNQGEVQKCLSDYRWHFEKTNSRGGVCCNAIGIKKDFLPNVPQQKFSFDFSELEKTAEKVMGLIIGDLCLVNVHCPMAEEGRMAMVNLDKCIPKDKRLIIAGDFNSFPDCRGSEQVAAIQKITETVCISDSAISKATGVTANRSFVAYPYDIVPDVALNMTGKLDHIFIKGLELEPNSKTLVHDDVTVVGKPFHPSDHFPITTTLIYTM